MEIDIEKFKEDYPNLTHAELSMKYNMKYEEILKLRNDLDLPPKMKELITKNKHYYFNKSSNSWKIERNGVYYGVVQTEEEAKKAIEFLKNNNWDKELFKKYMPKKKYKYYGFNRYWDLWIIQRGRTYYTSTKTEYEARKVVEFLKNHNWDKELLLKNKDKILEKGGEKA